MDVHVLLTSHLATDIAACQHLPEVLRVLDSDIRLLGPSPHQQKWVARVSSLLHSKEPSARWAGLTLALRTAQLSKALMLERAQGWVALALPMLSKNEPPPNAKAAIRLLAYVLSAAIDVPEFTRQLATPTVPKFGAAMLALAQKPDTPGELAILAARTLTQLLPLYPTAHKSMHGPLHSLALLWTSGGAPPSRRDAASALFSVLPHTGGKAGAAVLWRKAVDETLAFGWDSLRTLRTTYPLAGQSRLVAHNQEDPMVTVPLAIDRLKCTAVVLKDLLEFTTARPISFPVGPLVELVQAMLSCTTDGKIDEHIDATTRALEESAVSSIWAVGNAILVDLACTAGGHLTPFAPRLLTVLAFHLERPVSAAQRTLFLTSLLALLEHTHGLHHPLLPTRLTKAVLAHITPLLRPQSEDVSALATNGTEGGGKSRKGKKRARDYEGDEIFKMGGGVVLPTVADGEVALLALDVLAVLMRNSYVAPATTSLASRIILALQLSLPALPASQLNPDLSLHSLLLSKVQAIALDNAAGTTSVLGKSLPLLLHSSQLSPSEHHQVELLVHPRVPPLIRALPHVEALALFQAEEGDEEVDIRRGLGVAVVDEAMLPHVSKPIEVSTPVLVAPKPSAPIATPLLVAQANEASALLPSKGSVLFGTAPAPAAAQTMFSTNAVAPAPVTPVVVTPQHGPAPGIAPGLSQTGPAPPAVPPSSVPETFTYAPIQEDEDEDEPMPSIDVDSDSDEDDE